jgi:extradiol dioxygenase family protein
MVHWKFWYVCLLACASLFGFAASAHAEPNDDLRFFTFDEPVVTTLDQAPQDIALVTTAIVARMRADGAPETTPVIFAPNMEDRLREKSFRYAGFYVDSITVSFIGPANDLEEGRRIYGTIQFADEVGRRTATAFGVEYAFDAGEIYVSDLSLDLAVPVEPDIRLYLLPIEKASEMMRDASDNHLELMGFIAEHALDLEGLNGMCNCAIVTTSFDRLSGDAHLYASVSNAESGEKIVMGSHFLTDYDGWRVAVLEGQLDLSSNSNMRIDALYAAAPMQIDTPSTFAVARSFSPGGGIQ